MSHFNQHCDYCDRRCNYGEEEEVGLCRTCLDAKIKSPFWTIHKVREWRPFVTMRTKRGYVSVPTYPDPDHPEWCRVGDFGSWPYHVVAQVLNCQGVLNERPAGHGYEVDMYLDAKYPAKPPILGPQPEFWDVYYAVFHEPRQKR